MRAVPDAGALAEWVQAQWLQVPSARARTVAAGLGEQGRLVLGLALFAGRRTASIAALTGLTRAEVLQGLSAALSAYRTTTP